MSKFLLTLACVQRDAYVPSPVPLARHGLVPKGLVVVADERLPPLALVLERGLVRPRPVLHVESLLSQICFHGGLEGAISRIGLRRGVARNVRDAYRRVVWVETDVEAETLGAHRVQLHFLVDSNHLVGY